MGLTSLAETAQLLVHADEHEGSLRRRLQSVIKTVGLDLAASGSALDLDRLRLVSADLQHLKVLEALVEQCTDLSSQLAAKHSLSNMPIGPVVQDLAAFTAERWPSSQRLLSLAQKAGIDAVAVQIEFLTGVRRTLLDLPLPSFPNAETRQAVLDASQAALDLAIQREAA
jgi:type III secretion protein W